MKKDVLKKAEVPAAKKFGVKKAEKKPIANAPEKKPEAKAPAAKPKTTKPVKTPDVKQEDLVTAKKEEPKVLPEESKTQEVILDVPDACDAVAEGFKTKGKVGFYDSNSNDCKACGEDYPEALKACKHNTELEATTTATAKKVTAARKPREGLSVFGHGGAGGLLDAALIREEGASKEELDAIRGAVTSHLTHLRKQGVKLEQRGGRYYATA